jgi:acyl carrier protein
MKREEIVEGISNFIIAETNLEDSSFLEYETNLFESGLLDSLLIVSLVAFCESQFNCNIDTEDMSEENFQSIDALADLVLRTVGNAGSQQRK